MFNTIKANPKYFLVMAIVRGIYMPSTLVLSFSHIVALGHMTGLTGTQAYLAPFLVDGFAVMGMVFRSFDDRAMRRAGIWMQAVAGVASLAANVAAGRTLGERVFGALVVAAFVAAEQAGHVMSKRRSAVLVVTEAEAIAAAAAAKREERNARERARRAARKQEAERASRKAKRQSAEEARVAKRLLAEAAA
jgi:hypothetical protein